MLKRIGIIGLGNMGASMARNLIKSSSLKKHMVMVYDINKENMKSVAGDTGLLAGSIPELAANCDYIITMLPATAHVNSVLLDVENGVFRHAKKGALIIDSSTIDPLASKALHQQANDLSLRMLDAPVSGGVTGAAAGTLTFMVGGDKSTLDDAQDILESMGKNIVHCGGAGTGGVTKLCNNLSLAISMIGTCEAMNLGTRLGMDPARLAAVMNTSTARCWSSDSYNPVPGVMAGVPASRGYTGGFGSALMYKDLGLVLQASSAVGASLPLGEHAANLYKQMSAEESVYKDKDFSVVYDYLSKMGETSEK
jgi:3-hydroxyisobutyrate dehydrogenase